MIYLFKWWFSIAMSVYQKVYAFLGTKRSILFGLFEYYIAKTNFGRFRHDPLNCCSFAERMPEGEQNCHIPLICGKKCHLPSPDIFSVYHIQVSLAPNSWMYLISSSKLSVWGMWYQYYLIMNIHQSPPCWSIPRMSWIEPYITANTSIFERSQNHPSGPVLSNSIMSKIVAQVPSGKQT